MRGFPVQKNLVPLYSCPHIFMQPMWRHECVVLSDTWLPFLCMPSMGVCVDVASLYQENANLVFIY